MLDSVKYDNLILCSCVNLGTSLHVFIFTCLSLGKHIHKYMCIFVNAITLWYHCFFFFIENASLSPTNGSKLMNRWGWDVSIKNLRRSFTCKLWQTAQCPLWACYCLLCDAEVRWEWNRWTYLSEIGNFFIAQYKNENMHNFFKI